MFPCRSQHSFIHHTPWSRKLGWMLQTEQGKPSHPAYLDPAASCHPNASVHCRVRVKVAFQMHWKRQASTVPESLDCKTYLPNTHQNLPNNPSSSYSQGTADALRPVPVPHPPLRGQLCPEQSQTQPGQSKCCPLLF